MSNPFYTITLLLQRSMKMLIRLYLKKIEHNGPPDKQLILEEIELFIEDQSLMCPKIKQYEEDIKKLIFRDAQLLMYSLTQVPAVYINFFQQDDFLEKLEEQEIVEDELDLNLCKKALYIKLVYQLKQQIKDSEFLIDLIQEQLFAFIEIMNQKISQIYNEIREQILKMICDFNMNTKDLTFNNKYFIIGLMKDLSQKLYRYAEDSLEQTFFIFIDPDLREKFVSFIIEKHDVLSLSQQHQIKTFKTIYEESDDEENDDPKEKNQSSCQQPNEQSKIYETKNSQQQQQNDTVQQDKYLPLQRKKIITENQDQQEFTYVTDLQPETDFDSTNNTSIFEQKTSNSSIFEQKTPNTTTTDEEQQYQKQFLRQKQNITDNPDEFKFTEEQKQAMEKQEKREELAYKLGLIAKNGDLDHLKLTKIVRDDGHTGILVENEKKQQFIVHKNPYGKVIMVNSKFVSRQWKIYGQKILEEKVGLISNGLDTKGLESYISKVEQQQAASILSRQQLALVNTAAGQLGSSLGSCLANINKYESAGQFVQDFGSKAVVGGSMSYIIGAVPLFGTLMMAGGLGYTTLQLYQNKTADLSTKMKQAGKVALGTTSSVGGSISGAIVGEILIPIPVVGALIGGMIGGFLGSKATNSMFKYIETKHYVDLYNNLIKHIDEKGYWKYNNDLIKVFGVKKKFFEQSIPKLLNQLIGNSSEKLTESQQQMIYDIWITIISYTFITIFISEQEAKEYKKIQEEREKLKKTQSKQMKQEETEQNEKNEQKKETPKQEQQNQETEQSQISEEQQQQTVNTTAAKTNTQEQSNLLEEQKQETQTELEEDDKTLIKKQWPLYIELPQKWLKSQNIYLFDYLQDINKFINKFLSDACN